ncbi:hypothetical protein D3C76_42390 [compost metagenome]|jgi:hypothetical protein|uniref:hypothetical protein n=1 Tax=Paenibacillus sp. FSL R7-0216 TaxID=2921677 RepID=UPI000FC10B88|nr:hypothetical protein [Paenibacillus timonensis]MUG88832.1 hypothetical protein [Paenibacillus timonensis]GIP48724.1 hypothetical protein J53TS2_23150 [Paenibacillus sp. J53TS2]
MWVMWNLLLDRLPTPMTWVCAVLSAVIPWVIYSINQTLHRYGDPPWKRNAK